MIEAGGEEASTIDIQQQADTMGQANLIQVGEDLQSALDSDTFQIKSSLGVLSVTAFAGALFAEDGLTLRPAARRDLETIAARLISGPGGTIGITGHTDDQGDASRNQTRSRQQASAVADIFRAAGIRDFFLQVHGRGESEPVASNRTPEGRAQNHRIEIVFSADIH